MLPTEPWNPSARLAFMRDNYDRLVEELGTNSGIAPRPSQSGRLLRAPNSGLFEGSKSDRGPRRRGGAFPAARGANSGQGGSAKGMSSPGSSAGVLTMARLLQRLDAMAESAQITQAEAARLRKLWLLQESLLMGEDASEHEITVAQQLLKFLKDDVADPPASDILAHNPAPDASVPVAKASDDSAAALTDAHEGTAGATEEAHPAVALEPSQPAEKRSTASRTSKGTSFDATAASREAGEAELRPEDFEPPRSAPKTKQQKAEEQLRAGRLPSLSPDEEDPDYDPHKPGGARSKHHQPGSGSYVWSQLESKLAPEGVKTAPAWQQNAMERVQWQVELRRSKAAHAKQQQKMASLGVPSWDKASSSPKKSKALWNTREQRIAESAVLTEDGLSTRRGGSSSDEPLPDKEASPVHQKALKALEEALEAEKTMRNNQTALYDSGLQQLQLQAQELDYSLEDTKRQIDSVQRSGKAAKGMSNEKAASRRRDRLKLDLQEVQNKANAMNSSTQALMHIINSLRITRKRHVQRLRGMESKEKQMDSDTQFLIGSTSGAMEERERLRNKKERVKHESAQWHGIQLREATQLDEELAALDEQHDHLDSSLEELEEVAKRNAYATKRSLRLANAGLDVKHGLLQEQLGQWARDFERVTQITGVSFGESDTIAHGAVERVVANYLEKEARNSSLYKYVTEDVRDEAAQLEVELKAELELEQELEAAASRRTAASAMQTSPKSLKPEKDDGDSIDDETDPAASAAEAQLQEALSFLARISSEIELQLPTSAAIAMDKGESISITALPQGLSSLEDALDKKFAVASQLATAWEEANPPTSNVEEAPPESIAVLRALTAPRAISRYNPSLKLKQSTADAMGDSSVSG